MNNAYVLTAPAQEGGEDQWVMFAFDQERAHWLFGQFWFAREHLPPEWAGEDWEVFSLFGKEEELERAKRSNREGLGVYGEMKGWRIFTLEEVETLMDERVARG